MIRVRVALSNVSVNGVVFQGFLSLERDDDGRHARAQNHKL